MDHFSLSFDNTELTKLSSLALAHVGDAVYELMVRVRLAADHGGTAHGLHRAAVKLVAAPAQARAARRLQPLLTGEEAAVYKRGRNARVNSVPQAATLREYHEATGLEALFGWLYLRGEKERLNTLFEAAMEETDGT